MAQSFVSSVTAQSSLWYQALRSQKPRGFFLPGGSLQKHPKPLKPKTASCRCFKISQLPAGEQGEGLKGKAGWGPQQPGARTGPGVTSGKQV